MLLIYLTLLDDHFELTICHGSVFALVVRKLNSKFHLIYYKYYIIDTLIFVYLLYMYFSFYCFLNLLLLNFIVHIFARGLNSFLDCLCRQMSKVNLCGS